MSYVDPKLRPYFESLSIDLKNEILKQDVEIKSLSDLIQCLDRIVKQDKIHKTIPLNVYYSCKGAEAI